MKLKELFEERAINFELSDKEIAQFNDPSSSMKLGTFDGYEIYGERYSEHIDAYGIKADDKTVAIVYLDNVERLYDGKKCQTIIKLWVDTACRGKALIMSLLGFIVRKTKTSLISGSSVTIAGEKLFKKIIDHKAFDVVVYDTKTKSNLDHLPDDLFSMPNAYQIIIENLVHNRQDNEMFEGRLSHYRFFRGSDINWD